MKRMLVGLLALLLAAIPALGEVPAGGGAQYFEGGGFDSPENAVSAYLQAMRAGDVQGMLATFAIETCVDASDPQAYLERMWMFFPDELEGLPIGSAYARALAVNRRRAGLVDDLYMQYLFYSWQEAYGAFTGNALKLDGEDEVAAFLAEMSDSAFADALTELEVMEFVDPAEMCEQYASERNQALIAEQTACYGCDETADVVARLDIGGETWYQCMWCVRYGERWYNLKLSGNIGVLLGISSFAGGLVPASSLSM